MTEIPESPPSLQQTKSEEQPKSFPTPGREKFLARNGLLEGRWRFWDLG